MKKKVSIKFNLHRQAVFFLILFFLIPICVKYDPENARCTLCIARRAF